MRTLTSDEGFIDQHSRSRPPNTQADHWQPGRHEWAKISEDSPAESIGLTAPPTMLCTPRPRILNLYQLHSR